MRFQVKREYFEAPGKLSMGRKDFITKILQDLLKVKPITMHWLSDMLGRVEWELCFKDPKSRADFWEQLQAAMRNSQQNVFEFGVGGTRKV